MSWWKFWEIRRTGTDYYEEGVALLRQELFHDALTSFRLALREEPGDPATMEQMAVAYTQIGLTEEAIRSYREALRLRPGSPSAHYGVAFLLLKEGQSELAADHLETYLSSDAAAWEEDRHVKHARDTLERLRGGSLDEEGDGDPESTDSDDQTGSDPADPSETAREIAE